MGKEKAPVGALWRLSFLGRPWITVKVAPGQFSIDFADEGAAVLNAAATQAVRRISAHLQASKRKSPSKVFEELKFIFERLGGIIQVESVGSWDGEDEDKSGGGKPDAVH